LQLRRRAGEPTHSLRAGPSEFLECKVRRRSALRSVWLSILSRVAAHLEAAGSSAYRRRSPSRIEVQDFEDEDFNRTPRPPEGLAAPSPISSMPASSSAATTLVRLLITPRTSPLLDSMRWIVGMERPDNSAKVFWSMPRRAR